jgi:hypothetical protein
MKEVESSNIHSIGWKDGTLSVRFKSGDKVYDYPGFSETDWKAFEGAESIGKHFLAHIKGRDFTKRDA